MLLNTDQTYCIQIEISDYCNSRCPLCARHNRGVSALPVVDNYTTSLGDFKKWFPPEVVKRIHYFVICGNMGDPIVCEELVDICGYAFSKNPGLNLEISTNGGLRKTSWWARLGELMKDKPASHVKFFIDGLEDTNRIYRRGVDFSKIMENAQAFMQAGGKAYWGFLQFKHNQHQVEEIMKRAADMGFAAVHRKAAGGFDPDGKITFINENGAEETISETTEKWRATNRGTPQFPYNMNCRSTLGNYFFVDSHGLVFPCCWTASRARYVYPEFYNSKKETSVEFEKNYITSFKTLIDSCGGLEAFWLKNHPLDPILQLPLFSHLLEESWQKNTDHFCGIYCAQNRKNLDEQYANIQEERHETVKLDAPPPFK